MDSFSPKPDDLLVFHDFHRPRMTSGQHKITVDQTLTAVAGKTATSHAEQIIVVNGPQFRLSPSDVVATYPPNLAHGDFNGVLPHIILGRSTLPWERNPSSSRQPSSLPLSWLVLIVLSADERKTTRQYTVKASKLHSEALNVIPNDGASSDDPVNILEIPVELVKGLFPKKKNLRWCAHTRSVKPAGQSHANGEVATIVANRLPFAGADGKEGENHAYLLSVEGRYSGEAIAKASTGRIPFVLLYQWSFFVKPHKRGFTELIKQSAKGGHALSAKTEVAAAKSRQAAGFVPLIQHVRTGDTSAGWYHGPLLPAAPPQSLATIEQRLPASHADQLLSWDADFAMFDVAYAAAWELGRLLILEQTDIAYRLYHWKRAYAQKALATTSPPIPLARTPAADDPPDQTWITEALVEMRDVPFDYLVPDETMLPNPSLRFFDVDLGWIEALRDGALSVGRTIGRAEAIEKKLRKALLGKLKPMSGFLLRSPAVREFPGLEAEAYASPSPPKPWRSTTRGLKRVRFERLSDTTLLGLFEGQIRTLDLHLHPQGVHFGFLPAAHGTFTKTPHGSGHSVNLGLAGAADTTLDASTFRCIDMEKLAEGLGVKTPNAEGAVADFAKLMLDGVPFVRIKRRMAA